MDGIVLVDKPQGPTSHDVVRKLRKIFNTKKVGHAGTLDPMATGMLIIGIGKATRLLGYLTQSEKEYVGTIRLGATTTTDDAEGEITSQTSTRNLTKSGVIEALRDFRGHIKQRPSAVSAIQVAGKRAYALVRAGKAVDLPERDVTIHDCELLEYTDLPDLDVIDLEVRVVCSAGTYIRAIARDLGESLGVGGHLTSLRRTRSGAFTHMETLEHLESNPTVVDLTTAIKSVFACTEITQEQSEKALHGVRIPAPANATGTVGLINPEGKVISLCEVKHEEFVPLVVFV